MISCRRARVAELADAPDSKSGGRKAVMVRPHSRAPNPKRTMDIFVWATVILAIGAAVGPLIGIYIGHHLLHEKGESAMKKLPVISCVHSRWHCSQEFLRLNSHRMPPLSLKNLTRKNTTMRSSSAS